MTRFFLGYLDAFGMNSKIIYFTLATAFSQLLAFASLFLYTSFLEPGIYATIAVFEAVLFFLQVSVGMALDRSAQRFYIDHSGSFIISLATSGVLLISGFLLIILVIISLLFPILTYINVGFYEFVAIYMAAVGYIVHSIILVKYQFEEKPKLYFLTSVSKTGLFLLVSYLVLENITITPAAFIYSSFFTGCVLLFVSLVIAKPILIKEKNIPLFSEMLTYSMPFVPTLIASWLLLWSSRLFMVGNIEAGDIGVYGVTQRIGMVFFIFTQSISLVITPILYRNLKEEKISESILIIKRYFSIFLLVATSIVFVLPKLLSYIFDSQYIGVDYFLPFIVFVNFISALMGVSTTILFNFYKETALQMKIFFVVSLATLVLNIYLIPIYKMNGVLFNLVFSVLVLFFVHLYFCKKIIGLAVSYSYFLVLIFSIAFVCYLPSYMSKFYFSELTRIYIELAIAGLMLVYNFKLFIVDGRDVR